MIAKNVCKALLFFIILFALDIVLTRFVLYDFIRSRIGHNQFVRTYSSIYHHGFKPNWVVTDAQWGYGTYSFATNSLGFKDRGTRTIVAEKGPYRILVIGDSFTEGVGVPFEQTFSGIVSSRLEKRGIELLNAGVSSYSPVIYYRKIRHLYEDAGLRFNEAVVFLDISDILDEAVSYKLVDDVVVPRGRDGFKLALYRVRKKIQSFLKENSLMYWVGLKFSRMGNSGDVLDNSCSERFLKAGSNMRLLDSSFVSEFLFSDSRGIWTFNQAAYKEWGERGLNEAASNMTLLADFLREKGIRLTLVVYPWPHQIFKQELDSIQVSFWRKWAMEMNVPFINLFPDFINSEPPLEIYARYFIPCDMHWNGAGHRYVAESFLSRFKVGRGLSL